MARDTFLEGRCAGRWSWLAQQHLGDAYRPAAGIRPVAATLEEQRLIQKVIDVAAKAKLPLPKTPLPKMEEAVVAATLKTLSGGSAAEFSRGLSLMLGGREEHGHVIIGEWQSTRAGSASLRAIDTLAVLILLAPRMRAEEKHRTKLEADAERAKLDAECRAKKSKAKQGRKARARAASSSKSKGKQQASTKAPKAKTKRVFPSVLCPLCRVLGPLDQLRSHVIRKHPNVRVARTKLKDEALLKALRRLVTRDTGRVACPRCDKLVSAKLLDRHLQSQHGVIRRSPPPAPPEPPSLTARPYYVFPETRGPKDFGE